VQERLNEVHREHARSPEGIWRLATATINVPGIALQVGTSSVRPATVTLVSPSLARSSGREDGSSSA